MLPARRILVRCPNWVGDMVMATPTLRCLRQNYPSAHMAVMLKGYVRDVIEGAPWFDELIEVDQSGGEFGGSRQMSLVERVRASRFDLAVLLPNSFESALTAALGGVRLRVGYVRDARRLLLTHPVPRPTENGRFKPTYMGDFYLELCRRIGCSVGDRSLEVFTSEEDDSRARRVLDERGIGWRRPIVLVCPGASFGSSKLWPVQHFAQLADMLVGRLGVNVVITGSHQEAEIARQIRAGMCSPAIDLTDIGELCLFKSVVKLCELMVTVDSGSRHFAVAMQKPAVVLMGSTHPGYTRTDLEIGEVVRVEVECGPCQEKSCPTDHRCMTLITPERVFEACVRALGP